MEQHQQCLAVNNKIGGRSLGSCIPSTTQVIKVVSALEFVEKIKIYRPKSNAYAGASKHCVISRVDDRRAPQFLLTVYEPPNRVERVRVHIASSSPENAQRAISAALQQQNIFCMAK